MLNNTPTHLYINGAWTRSSTGASLSIYNPCDESHLADVAAGSVEDVDRAVQAAHAAFPAWSATTSAARGHYLRAIAQKVEDSADALATLQSQNSGKPLIESQMDVGDVIATFRYYAQLIESFDTATHADVALPDNAFSASVHKEACGVVGLIVPWNFPMVTTAWKVAPALAAGCTVVLKPSEFTPLTELALASIFDAAGLPAGVVNVVPGTGAMVGAAIAEHPLVSKISFTGSNAVGSLIMQAAAKDIKGVSLELGGKSAILVFEDADMGLAVDLVMAGGFFNAGQMCSATSRVLVAESIADAFLARLGEATAKMVVADPYAEGVQMGPLINRAQYERVMRFIAQGVADGCSLVCGGTRMPGFAKGHFIAPTIFTNVPADNALWCEEIFGPVLCVRRFADEAYAIAEANESAFGLVATVVTQDAARALRVASALQVGLVWVNAPQVIFPQTAWGGRKKSSLGRELGPWGLAAFQETKHVVSAVSGA
jgi:betaine-aldehyde dehydrogenase